MVASEIEFWRLPTVAQKTGLSESEIYRRMSAGTFPKNHAYKGSKKKFWLSSEVSAWQVAELGFVPN